MKPSSKTENSSRFPVTADGKKLLDRAAIGMSTDRGEFGKDASAKGSKSKSVDAQIKTRFGIKNSIRDNFNEARVDFGSYSVVVRAYDDAAAYRFVSNGGGGEMTVKSETLVLPLKDSDKVIAHIVPGMRTSFESVFTRTTSRRPQKAQKGLQRLDAVHI